MPLIRISEDIKEKLIELQGKLQSELGKRVSLGDTITYLITGSIDPLLTDEDHEYLAKMRRGNKKKYAKAMLINYAILNHLSWNEANSILRDKCGSDVEHASGSPLECIISFLEKEVFKKD